MEYIYKTGSLPDLSSLKSNNLYIIIQRGPGVVDCDFSIKMCDYQGFYSFTDVYLFLNEGKFFLLSNTNYKKTWLLLDKNYCKVDNQKWQNQDNTQSYHPFTNSPTIITTSGYKKDFPDWFNFSKYKYTDTLTSDNTAVTSDYKQKIGYPYSCFNNTCGVVIK